MQVLNDIQMNLVSGGELVEWPIPGQEPNGWAQWNEAQRQAFLNWYQNQAMIDP